MHHYFVENENIEEIASNEFELLFSECDKNHVRAQRLKKGEHISVVDKSKNYFELELVDIKSDKYIAKISQRKDFKPNAHNISLFLGVSKKSKLEDVLRPATEIGINNFYAVNMQRSVAIINDDNKNKKLNRLSSVARSASMQCGRCDIPNVDVFSDIKCAKEALLKLDILLVFWEGASKNETIEHALMNRYDYTNVGIMVGPEGGFSSLEIEFLSKLNNCKICTLGNTILRAETAGVVSVSLVKYELERQH